MRFVLIIFSIILFLPLSHAQQITFSTQNEIDSFAINYPGVNRVKDVIIEESIPGGITNLLGLNQLTRIDSFLIIRNNRDLESLDGLGNVGLARKFYVQNNDRLVDLHGLDQLYLIWYFEAEDNGSLKSLDGIPNLVYLSRRFRLINNPKLESLGSFHKVIGYPREQLEIFNNPMLSLCDAKLICWFLIEYDTTNPDQFFNVANNGPGCSNLEDLNGNCSEYASLRALTSEGARTVSPNTPVTWNSWFSGSGDNSPWVLRVDSITTGSPFSSFSISEPLPIQLPSRQTEWRFSVNYSIPDTGTYVDTVRVYYNHAFNSPKELIYQLRVPAPTACSVSSNHFRNQRSIDDFPYQYQSCDTILGDVLIQGADIVDLNGLDQLKIITGDLVIRNNPELDHLYGLENIRSVGGAVVIENNDDLISLQGLEGVTAVPGHLKIEDNFNLTDLTGIHRVEKVGGDLEIVNNAYLLNLDKLSNIKEINGRLKIADHYNLSSIWGLRNIDPHKIINLDLSYNSVLTDCILNNLCVYLSNEDNDFYIAGNASPCYHINNFKEKCLNFCSENMINIETPVLADSVLFGLSVNSSSFHGDTTTVIYKASQGIRLLPGFHAPKGSSFFANIDYCIPVDHDGLEQLIAPTLPKPEMNEKQLTISPNPVWDICTIQVPVAENNNSLIIVSIVNTDGKSFYRRTYPRNTFEENLDLTVNLKQLPDGLYFVRIKNDEKTFTRKLVKVGG